MAFLSVGACCVVPWIQADFHDFYAAKGGALTVTGKIFGEFGLPDR
jgi:hypothetical protein